MAQASAPDDSDDELQLLAALERDLEAVSLSDGELEGEEQEIELPEVMPLGSVEELLAAADAAEQPEEEGGAEDLLARLRASLEDGERQRQCFMEDVQALHGLTSSVEPQVMAPAAEAHEADDGSGWAGEEPWWVEERRQQAEAERAREEQRRLAQEEMERQQEAQRQRQQEKLEARQAEQERAFAAQEAALLAAQEARRREQEEQRRQALVREAEAEAERQREAEAAAAAEQRYMEREAQFARRQQERKQRAKAAAAAFAAAEAERERIDELKRREKEVRCCSALRRRMHHRAPRGPTAQPPRLSAPAPPPAPTPPAAHWQPTPYFPTRSLTQPTPASPCPSRRACLLGRRAERGVKAPSASASPLPSASPSPSP